MHKNSHMKLLYEFKGWMECKKNASKFSCVNFNEIVLVFLFACAVHESLWMMGWIGGGVALVEMGVGQ